MRKEFFEFLVHRETPSRRLHEATRKDIVLSFRGRSIIMKYLSFQFLGTLLSMSVCPQFGLGMVEGHGITHGVRMIGDWACAAFCGTFFLTAGVAAAFIGMRGEELWWVWRRYKFPLIILPAAFWGLLMLFNVGLELGPEEPGYHLIWFLTALLAQTFWMQVRSSVFQRTQLTSL